MEIVIAACKYLRQSAASAQKNTRFCVHVEFDMLEVTRAEIQIQILLCRSRSKPAMLLRTVQISLILAEIGKPAFASRCFISVQPIYLDKVP